MLRTMTIPLRGFVMRVASFVALLCCVCPIYSDDREEEQAKILAIFKQKFTPKYQTLLANVNDQKAEIKRCETDYKFVTAKELVANNGNKNGPRLFMNQAARASAIKTHKTELTKAESSLKEFLASPEKCLLPSAGHVGDLKGLAPEAQKLILASGNGHVIGYTSKVGDWGILGSKQQVSVFSKSESDYVVELKERKRSFRANEGGSEYVVTRFLVPETTKAVKGKSTDIPGVFIVRELRVIDGVDGKVLERFKFKVEDLLPEVKK
jgi:hypothetical protein